MVVDLGWAVDDYLLGPDGIPRLLRGLSSIAQVALQYDAQILWDNDSEHLGYCYPDVGVPVLSSELIDAWPYIQRRVLTHEIGHLAVGSDEDAVRSWQQRLFGELVIAPEWGCI